MDGEYNAKESIIIGHVKIDISAKERKLTQTYSLSSPEGVAQLLRDRHRIGERRFKGDTAASDILLDLDKAIAMARITDRQALAITLVHGLDLTQSDAAAELGITRQAVAQALDTAYAKIARIYRWWKYDDVTIEFDEEGAANE
jgi:DNA-directed RNA polymerase specialized sigma24 family protein